MSASLSQVHQNSTFRYLVALSLICFGVLAILVNLNVVSSSVWSRLNRLWPTWLIIAGLMLFLKNRFRMRVVGTVMILGIFLILIITHQQVRPFTIEQATLLSRIPLISTTTNQRSSTKFTIPANTFTNEIESHDFSISLQSGELRLEDRPLTRDLEVTTSLPIETKAEFRYATESGRVTSYLMLPRISRRQSATADINLGTSLVPTSLTINQDTGSQRLKFNAVPLNSLNSSLDSGIMDIIIGKNASSSATLDLNVEVGTIRITLPQSFGFSLDHEVNVGASHVRGERIGQGIYTSENYDEATTKLSIHATVGVGKIEVVLVE